VIDAREEFARGYALPALQAGVAEGGWGRLIRSLSLPLVNTKLHDIAAIEKATIVTDAPPHVVDASLLGRIVTGEKYVLTKTPAQAGEAAAVVEITLADGVPVAINDVSMRLTELIEILSIIAGEHGVGRIEDVEAPAAVVLQAALLAGEHGVVRMKLFKGTCERMPELVTQS
jgi:argininosuccinate synthase